MTQGPASSLFMDMGAHRGSWHEGCPIRVAPLTQGPSALVSPGLQPESKLCSPRTQFSRSVGMGEKHRKYSIKIYH